MKRTAYLHICLFAAWNSMWIMLLTHKFANEAAWFFAGRDMDKQYTEMELLSDRAAMAYFSFIDLVEQIKIDIMNHKVRNLLPYTREYLDSLSAQ
jgi:hypothetical protein